MYKESLNYHNSQMVTKSQDIQAINEAYMNVYESKKIDQDVDGDNDFADVRIARMIASGVPREEAIRRVKDKAYKEEFEIDEGIGSIITRMLGKGKKQTQSSEGPQGRTAQLRQRYGVTSRTGENSPRGKILSRMQAQIDADSRKHGKKSSAVQSSTSARNQMLKGGYSQFGMGDARGRGKKARDRAEALKNDFELWIGELLDEGYDLSDYTWDEMYELYEENLTEAVLGRDVESRKLRPASERTSTALTSSQRASARAKERREEEKQRKLEALANRVIAQETGTSGRRGTGKAVRPTREPSTGAPTPSAETRKIASGQKKDTKAAQAAKIIAALRRENEATYKKGAEVLKQVQQEEFEIYEELLSYLLENEYADDVEGAVAILENSSDEWLYEIIEEIGLV